MFNYWLTKFPNLEWLRSGKSWLWHATAGHQPAHGACLHLILGDPAISRTQLGILGRWVSLRVMWSKCSSFYACLEASRSSCSCAWALRESEAHCLLGVVGRLSNDHWLEHLSLSRFPPANAVADQVLPGLCLSQAHFPGAQLPRPAHADGSASCSHLSVPPSGCPLSLAAFPPSFPSPLLPTSYLLLPPATPYPSLTSEFSTYRITPPLSQARQVITVFLSNPTFYTSRKIFVVSLPEHRYPQY